MFMVVINRNAPSSEYLCYFAADHEACIIIDPDAEQLRIAIDHGHQLVFSFGAAQVRIDGDILEQRESRAATINTGLLGFPRTMYEP